MRAPSKSNEIPLTRIYEAPVKTVWAAFTDEQQAAQWWGPRGFTLTNHHKDLRVGGGWHYTMHGPDGTDYINKTIYREVQENHKLVYDHGGNDEREPLFRVTVTFDEVKNGTQMNMIMALPTAEAAAQTREFIKQANGNSTWDRLAEYLDKKLRNEESFVINRSFNTSLETMFEMWTNPDHFSKWLAPTGFNMKFLRADIKEGHSSFYVMENDQGIKMYGTAEYTKIQNPNLIMYKQSFRDEKENLSRHIFDPNWPATMLTMVTFTAEDENQTRVTIHWSLEKSATPQERETFVNGRSGMTQGWTGSFNKLEQLLSES